MNQNTIDQAYDTLKGSTDKGHIKAIADALVRNTDGPLRDEIVRTTKGLDVPNAKIEDTRDQLLKIVGQYITGTNESPETMIGQKK